MRLSLKPLVAAMFCLAGMAPAWAAEPVSADAPQRPHARSPLAALGGSTFDPSSLTGAVTLDRVLEGLALQRDMNDYAPSSAATAPSVSRSAPGLDKLSPDQLAHLRTALGRSGIGFEYRVMAAKKMPVPCVREEEKLAQAQDLKEARCFAYGIGEPLQPPTYLLGHLANRGLRNATFVLSRPTERRLGREAEMSKPSCAPDSPLSYRTFEQSPRQGAALGAALLTPHLWGMESMPVTLLQVSALIDRRVLDEMRGKGAGTEANAKARYEAYCLRSSVWTYDLSGTGMRLLTNPNGELNQFQTPLTQ